MLLMPLFLSPEQQGYWYLFGSLGALSIFADLGFTNIILQFSAYEYSFLYFTDNGILVGEEENLQRLGSFFRFVIKWILTICVIVFPIIYSIGIFFFIRDKILDIYFLPWTLYSIGTLINFFDASILSFIEGLDKIAIVQKIRFQVAVINTCIVITILILGGNVYALVFSILISSLVIFLLVFAKFKKCLQQLLIISNDFIFNWKKEVLPLFIKYAFTFSSSYLLFQIYTPLMHYFHGAVDSGKVGITISLVTAIYSLSYIWIYTIVPKMNMLISKKTWHELDILFQKRLLLALGTFLFVIIGLFLFITIFGSFWIIPRIMSRFLPPISLVMLLICHFLQLIINSLAVYLRGYKKEPWVVFTIIVSCFVFVSTMLIGKHLQPKYYFIGYLSSFIFSLPWCLYIFAINKKRWQN